MAVVPYESASRVVIGDTVGSESTVCWMDSAKVSPASVLVGWPTRTHESELPTKSVGHLRRHDRDRLASPGAAHQQKLAENREGGRRVAHNARIAKGRQRRLGRKRRAGKRTLLVVLRWELARGEDDADRGGRELLGEDVRFGSSRDDDPAKQRA